MPNMRPRYFAVFNNAEERDVKKASFMIIRQSIDPPIDEFWGRDLNHHTTSSFRRGLYPYYIELPHDAANTLLESWRRSWRSDHASLYADRDLALANRAVTYFAQLDYGRSTENPSGMIRRIHLVGGGHMDEELDADMAWCPTEFLHMYARGHMDTDYTEITIEEGEAIVDRWLRNGHRRY